MKWLKRLFGIETRPLRNDSGGCCRPYPEESPHLCKCHERMGNDFYFLPTGTCLFGDVK